MKRFLLTSLFASALVLAGAAPAFAHRYHTSITRIDQNVEAKTLEITIQLFAHDVTDVLSKKAKRPVDLGKPGEIDPMLMSYIQDNFVLRDSTEKDLPLKWIGKETEVDKVFIYLEVPFEGDLSGATLRNSIFFESFATQTNLVVARYAGKKTDLAFKRGDRVKAL